MSNRQKCAIIIPTRYHSTRFPGKPLATLCGKPMVQWVYENAQRVTSYVFVATDDKRIAETVEHFGGNVIFSQKEHKNGSERVFEACSYLKEQGLVFTYIINLQGDEPLVTPNDIQLVINKMEDTGAQIGTLTAPFRSMKEARDVNSVKIVPDSHGYALYFSRALIPFFGNANDTYKPKATDYYKHIGVYAFRQSIISTLENLPPSTIENIECLEQLRWIENGYSICLAHTSTDIISINSPNDLNKAEKLINKRK